MAKVFRATWQRCRIHFGRNAAAYAGKTQRCIVSAWIGAAYAEADAPAAHAQWAALPTSSAPRCRS